MVSVITGDIIHSRKLKDQSVWITPLKKLLHTLGETPKVWEIYRGDSFQVEIKAQEEALLTAIHIKAIIKCIKGIDVRMAIGLGPKNYTASKITESNGTAFVHSGKELEELKKGKQTLSIKTPWPTLDREINVWIRLALIVMDDWTPASAELVKILLEHPGMGQQEVSSMLGIAQSSVSERQNRAHYAEIMDMDVLFREKINQQIKNDLIP